MKAVFLMDPIEHLNPKKDTSLALMLEAQNQGFTCYYLSPKSISIKNHSVLFSVQKVQLSDLNKKKFYVLDPITVVLDSSAFSVLFIRLDPPFNEDYLACTWLLDYCHESLLIMNSPAGIRSSQEKLSCLQFPKLIPDTCITSSPDQMKAFLNGHKKCVLKPLDQFGGTGIFLLNHQDSNSDVAFQQLTQNYSKPCIIQAFVPDAKHGDKRILLLNGEPLGAVMRKNLGSDHRHNFFAGGLPFKTDINKEDLKIIYTIQSFLVKNGLYFVGIDILGDKLIEINVTSPTCLQEISNLNKINLAKKVLEFVQLKLMR